MPISLVWVRKGALHHAVAMATVEMSEKHLKFIPFLLVDLFCIHSSWVEPVAITFWMPCAAMLRHHALLNANGLDTQHTQHGLDVAVNFSAA